MTRTGDPQPDPSPASDPPNRWAVGGDAVAPHSATAEVVGQEAKSAVASTIEWVLVIGGAVLLAVIVKMVLLQAFYIPSASMYPTLQKGDRVLVNKLSYKLHDVNRGDVVVFERPPSRRPPPTSPTSSSGSSGLPGESDRDRGRPRLHRRAAPRRAVPARGCHHDRRERPLKCARDAPCVVPEGDVWVMGDNRNDSKDSRYFGPIDEDSIVGRAFVVVWPLNRLGLL